MKWLKKPYLGAKAQRHAREILRAAEQGVKSRQDGCYLVVLSPMEGAQLELISLWECRRNSREDLHVLGMAASRWEAMQLVEKIARDCLRRSGKPDFKACFGSMAYVPGDEVLL